MARSVAALVVIIEHASWLSVVCGCLCVQATKKLSCTALM